MQQQTEHLIYAQAGALPDWMSQACLNLDFKQPDATKSAAELFPFSLPSSVPRGLRVGALLAVFCSTGEIIMVLKVKAFNLKSQFHL